MSSRMRFRFLGLAAMVVVLAACISQQSFVKGKALLEQGNLTDGFSELQKAVEQDPQNIEYKKYYFRQRETWVNRLLREADNAVIDAAWDKARLSYEQILLIDTNNKRAQDGLKSIEAGQLNEVRLLDAKKSLDAGDLDAATEKARTVLAEAPGNTEARKLIAKIERKKSEESSPASIINSKFKKKVTLEFRDANIKSVFELLSKSAGINFLLDKEIRSDSKVSIFVTQTSIEEALQNILSTSQLSKRVVNEKSVLIYPNSKKADFEEKIVRTFYLNNVEVKQVQNLLKTVLKTKDMFIDDQMNILVMRDSIESIRLAEKLINSYDIGDPEVLLEVEVLEVSTNKLTELGIRWPSQVSIGVVGAEGNGQLSFEEARNFNSSMGRLSITDPALILNLRASDSATNLLANPHIRVKNHKKANVHIGDRVPVITNTSTSTGFVAESVTYLDVGLKLNVQPSILIDDQVSIDVGLEVSNIVSEITSRNGTLTYRVGTRNANTTLRLKNGETQILAGLINDEERSNAERVPGISKLPILGRLFSSNRTNRTKTEIVLLITPRMIRNIVPPDVTSVEFSVGTDSGNSPVTMSSEGAMILAPLEPANLDNPAEIVPQTHFGAPLIQDQVVLPQQQTLDIPPPPMLPLPPGTQMPR